MVYKFVNVSRFVSSSSKKRWFSYLLQITVKPFWCGNVWNLVFLLKFPFRFLFHQSCITTDPLKWLIGQKPFETIVATLTERKDEKFFSKWHDDRNFLQPTKRTKAIWRSKFQVSINALSKNWLREKRITIKISKCYKSLCPATVHSSKQKVCKKEHVQKLLEWKECILLK